MLSNALRGLAACPPLTAAAAGRAAKSASWSGCSSRRCTAASSAPSCAQSASRCATWCFSAALSRSSASSCAACVASRRVRRPHSAWRRPTSGKEAAGSSGDGVLLGDLRARELKSLCGRASAAVGVPIPRMLGAPIALPAPRPGPSRRSPAAMARAALPKLALGAIRAAADAAARAATEDRAASDRVGTALAPALRDAALGDGVRRAACVAGRAGEGDCVRATGVTASTPPLSRLASPPAVASRCPGDGDRMALPGRAGRFQPAAVGGVRSAGAGEPVLARTGDAAALGPSAARTPSAEARTSRLGDAPARRKAPAAAAAVAGRVAALTGEARPTGDAATRPGAAKGVARPLEAGGGDGEVSLGRGARAGEGAVRGRETTLAGDAVRRAARLLAGWPTSAPSYVWRWVRVEVVGRVPCYGGDRTTAVSSSSAAVTRGPPGPAARPAAHLEHQQGGLNRRRRGPRGGALRERGAQESVKGGCQDDAREDTHRRARPCCQAHGCDATR